MIVLQKMNGERFLVNHNQIECIEMIPECKNYRFMFTSSSSILSVTVTIRVLA